MKRNGEVNNEAGFTLIELVFVVLILSVLVSIATLTYSNFQNRATTDLVWVDLKVIRAAARTYYMNHQTFPSDIQNLVDNGYLDELPGDKFAPVNPYKSKLLAPDSFEIWSLGPNGVDDNGINDGGVHDDLALTFGP
jgi:general secretion pathway protein G